MLGVLKRRLKPKRTVQSDTNQTLVIEEKSRPGSTTNVRHQVHPICDEKAHLLAAYDHRQQTTINNIEYKNGHIHQACLKRESKRLSSHELNTSPPPYQKRASYECSATNSPTYPLAPNICVERGRIEFIKVSPEGDCNDTEHCRNPLICRDCGIKIGHYLASEHNSMASGDSCVNCQHVPPLLPSSPRITVTRGIQTDFDSTEDRLIKEYLERKISDLEEMLLQLQNAERTDKQELARLQNQILKREAVQRDADRERRLRADSESKTKQALLETARYRSRLKFLTSEFSRMEETVRSMLVFKKQAEILRQEKFCLTNAYENRCLQYQNTIQRLNQEISGLRQQAENATGFNVGSSEALLFQKHVDESRKQYEQCLDDVANQVVRALVTQKCLKEEVVSLNTRIAELEAQNSTLNEILFKQITVGAKPAEASGLIDRDYSLLTEEGDNTSADVSPLTKSKNSLSLKQYDNSDVHDAILLTNTTCISPKAKLLQEFNNCNNVCGNQKNEKYLSLRSENLDSRLSFEDKKRHQILTKLWADFQCAEATPKRLIAALATTDLALSKPPQRPVSLNIQYPISHTAKYCCIRPILQQSFPVSASDETTETCNESPESGNRDEGYSTMSSDVQAEVSRLNTETVTRITLEELKEASDETDNNGEADIFFIPINLLNLKSRNSYPPGKGFLPFQHIMRSSSDSNLCIKITTTPSSNCYGFNSSISSSSSILVVDITDCNRNCNLLRRTKCTSTLAASSCSRDDFKSPHSLNSSYDERMDCSTFDADYIQHWLRLDDTRRTAQQHKDIFELEYDKTELEDWSLNLSNEDLRELHCQSKSGSAITPGQYSVATLPSIQENNALELEEDAIECLWNSSSYMVDHEGHEIVTLLMDTSPDCQKWPYAFNYQFNVNTSSDNSWSSGGSDCCPPEACSKRSSAALSGCSDDTGELPLIGTDFTRDFYRLVKFESTKSLASTSSRSVGCAHSENGEHDATIQNVLTFIAEQQLLVQNSPISEDLTKEFNIEAPPQMLEEIKVSPLANLQSSIQTAIQSENCKDDNEYLEERETAGNSPGDNYVTLKELSELTFENVVDEKISYAEELFVTTPFEAESENYYLVGATNRNECANEVTTVEEVKCRNEMTESFTSNVSNSEIIVSKIPLRKKSKIPVSPAKVGSGISKYAKTRIPYRTASKGVLPLLVSNSSSGAGAECVTHPGSSKNELLFETKQRAINFSERASSKDVIDELNRIIRNGEEKHCHNTHELLDTKVARNLDEGCISTGWVHVERSIDLNDPKARTNILDVIMATASSDSSSSSSCSGSVSSEYMDDPLNYGQLHKIHRYHRQKQAHATRPEMAVVRSNPPQNRPSIIGRPDFFVRYGDKEKEAVSFFDFLDDICPSENGSE